MTFQTIGDVLREGKATPPQYRQAIEDVLDAAMDWQEGRLPWPVAASIGDVIAPGSGQVSSCYSRWIAVRYTAPDDSRHPALMAFIDECCRMTGYVVTPQGVFAPHELREHDRARQWIAQHGTEAA